MIDPASISIDPSGEPLIPSSVMSAWVSGEDHVRQRIFAATNPGCNNKSKCGGSTNDGNCTNDTQCGNSSNSGACHNYGRCDKYQETQ